MDHAVATTGHYLVLGLDDQRYALGLAQVDRILRAAEVTPLPGLGGATLGIINIQGDVLPAISLRRRLGLADRPLALTDQLILARAADRAVVLVADRVEGVGVFAAEQVPLGDLLAPDGGATRLPGITGVVRQAGELLIVIGDLPAFLAAAPLPDSATLAAAALPAFAGADSARERALRPAGAGR